MADIVKAKRRVSKSNFREGRFHNLNKHNFRNCAHVRKQRQCFQRKKVCDNLFNLLQEQCLKEESNNFKKLEKEVTLDNELYEFINRIPERLKHGFDSNEEKAMFLTNVVEQTSLKEVELSCNRTTSHTMEMLLATCEDGIIIIKFANAFSSNLRQICTNQYGSHVVESLLSCGMKFIKKYAENNVNYLKEEETSNAYLDIISWILKFGKFGLNNIEHFLGHTYASHVLRALVEVWSGIIMEQSVRKSNKSISQRRKFHSSEEIPILVQSNKVSEHIEVEIPEEFVSQLKEFYLKVTKLNNLIDCCIDAKVSPILQTLIFGLQKRTPKHCQKFIKLLMKNVIVWENDENVPIALTNKSSSCVIEKAVLVADEKRQNWIWKHCFKNRMKCLALHPIANFIVQRLFGSIKEKVQFEEIFNEICPHFKEILSVGHNGVIVSIAEACVKLGICQAPFMQLTMKSLQCLEPEQRQLYLAPLVIQLTTYSTFEETIKIAENSMLFKDIPLSYHGSLLLQHMLKFHKPIKIVKSILSLKDDLKLLACDAKGSHVLESFLTGSNVGEKNREKLLYALKPHLVALACDKFGSRILDSLWTTAPLKQRALISQELSSKESVLNDNVFGRYISRKCGLFYFKNRNNDWKQVQNLKTKKQKLFNDILS